MKSRIASKLLAIVLLALLLAPTMMGLNQRSLARINRMPAEQLLDHERHVLGHTLAYHFITFVVGLTFAVAFVDGIAWCIQTPFQHWARQGHNPPRTTPPPLPNRGET